MFSSISFYRSTPEAPFTYAQLLEIQKKRMRENQAGLLLAEVAPVITLGRGVREERRHLELFQNTEWYAQQGIEVLEVDRGGLATWHGPGQWILFPVMPGIRPEVKKVTKALLEVLRLTAASWVADPRVGEGTELGLWSETGKIGALGIRFEREGLSHGVSLNVYKTPLSFKGLRPCGLDLPVSYLRPGAQDFEKVGQDLAQNAQNILFLKE